MSPGIIWFSHYSSFSALIVLVVHVCARTHTGQPEQIRRERWARLRKLVISRYRVYTTEAEKATHKAGCVQETGVYKIDSTAECHPAPLQGIRSVTTYFRCSMLLCQASKETSGFPATIAA